MFQCPLVTEAMAKDYYRKEWHMGCGVKPILDNTTFRFAVDLSNIVLKQFVAEYSVVIKKQVVDEIRALAQKKQAEQVEAPKGSIVLTD